MPLKPSQNEEEYARKQEMALLAKRKREADARRAQEDKEALKTLHFMHCPKCGQPLQEERYHKIQVDRCTACGGIWFDAGEAESLLDRAPSALQGFFGDLLKGIGGSTSKS
jgi:uncharacterized protein